MNWHGKALGAKADDAIAAIEAVMVNKNITGEKLNTQVVVDDVKPVDPSAIALSEKPSYEAGVKVATRVAYGTALAKLGRSSDRVVALDGDTKNSTFAITFQKEFPGMFLAFSNVCLFYHTRDLLIYLHFVQVRIFIFGQLRIHYYVTCLNNVDFHHQPLS